MGPSANEPSANLTASRSTSRGNTDRSATFSRWWAACAAALVRQREKGVHLLIIVACTLFDERRQQSL